MKRRVFLTAAATAAIAGCTSSPDDADPANTDDADADQGFEERLTERIYTDSTYPIELAADDTVRIHVINNEGYQTRIILYHRESDDDPLLDEAVATEDTFETTAERDGVHDLHAYTEGNGELELAVKPAE